MENEHLRPPPPVPEWKIPFILFIFFLTPPLNKVMRFWTLKTADNIAMGCFKMVHKLLIVLKMLDNESVLPVTQPTEDLQALLSPA